MGGTSEAPLAADVDILILLERLELDCASHLQRAHSEVLAELRRAATPLRELLASGFAGGDSSEVVAQAFFSEDPDTPPHMPSYSRRHGTAPIVESVAGWAGTCNGVELGLVVLQQQPPRPVPIKPTSPDFGGDEAEVLSDDKFTCVIDSEEPGSDIFDILEKQHKEERQNRVSQRRSVRRVSQAGDDHAWRDTRQLKSVNTDSVFGGLTCRLTFTTENQRWAVAEVVKSAQFDCFCAAFILLNCITLGAQAHEEATHSVPTHLVTAMAASEHVFTLLFCSEVFLRLYVYGLRGYTPLTSFGRSNLLDAFLVLVTGVITAWVVPLYAAATGSGTQGQLLRTLSVLRAIRLVRLFKVFRDVPIFYEAWMLIRGLSDSCRTLIWTVVVILFVTYAFAILGLALFAGILHSKKEELADNPEDIERISYLLEVLGGLDRIMFTLCQVLTQDSFHTIVRSLIVYVPWAWIFFYAYIAVGCWVLLNLVNAVIIENAFETSRMDQEQELQAKAAKEAKELEELEGLFYAMDTDGSGSLSWSEFKVSFQDDELCKRWRLLDFNPADAKELFQLLDTGEGEIDVKEFFEGLNRIKGVAQAKDVYKLSKMVTRLLSAMDGGSRSPSKP